MATRQPLAPFEYYHVFNRGTEKRRVFQSKADFGRFLSLLYLCNSTSSIHLSNLRSVEHKDIFTLPRGKRLVQIGAYCLMPNHFHLVLRQENDAGISSFMQKLITGYTMYFNKANDRTGVLFQGKYKSVHADNDVYLKYVLSYIHLNPGRNYLEYKYSSLRDYLDDDRPQGKLLDKESLPEYFKSADDLLSELKEWEIYRIEENIKVGP